MFTDNKDFYPTPSDLMAKLLNGKRNLSGRVLEPSAGKGDMIKYIKSLPRGKDIVFDAIENDPRLVNELMSEDIAVVWDDLLTYETYKEYDYIVMNPPFSNGVDHVLKALDLAEAQLSHCEIYAILNKQTIDNAYSNTRQDLLRRLDEHGAELRYVSDSFSSAERKTDVEVALIHVRVEKKGAGRSIYDNIPFTHHKGEDATGELGTAVSTYVKSSEVQTKINDIERYVLEYEKACGLARDTFEAIHNKRSFYGYISKVNEREGEFTSPLSLIETERFDSEDLNEELDRLRRGYWELILNAKEFRKMLTNESIRNLNRQMGIANEMEINLTNIRMLLVALGSNQSEMLLDSVVSMFKRITSYHMNDYSANIHYYDGWKTNDAYKINHKIIIPISGGGFDGWDFGKEYDRITMDVRDYIDDIVKAFQLIDPTVNNEFTAISDKEYENDLLRFRMFLNGNIHVWFKDAKLLAKLNYICGSHFGWIPSDGEQEKSEEAREYVAEEFGDMGGVTLLRG